MKRCRCCRQTWPLEFYKTDSARQGWRSSRCAACNECKRFAQRYYQRNREACIERTRSWKARVREDIVALRRERAA